MTVWKLSPNEPSVILEVDISHNLKLYTGYNSQRKNYIIYGQSVDDKCQTLFQAFFIVLHCAQRFSRSVSISFTSCLRSWIVRRNQNLSLTSLAYWRPLEIWFNTAVFSLILPHNSKKNNNPKTCFIFWNSVIAPTYVVRGFNYYTLFGENKICSERQTWTI